jgi:hypothetical protein
MFAALVGWYTGSERNRRRYPRVKRDFDIEYTIDGNRWTIAQGVDLSGGGMCMVSKYPILPEVFDARIDVGERRITMQVRRIWGTTTQHNGRESPYYGLQFLRIKPEDWDAIIRSITGPNTQAVTQLESIPLAEGEANVLLPLQFREQMLSELRIRSRIDPKKPLPVVYEYGGLINEKNELLHRFTVRSSINSYAGLKRFTTQVLVRDDDSEVRVVS